MPRSARKKSNTGIYHIIFRGINKQKIFEDIEDNQAFLSKLRIYKETSGYEIYAYCLMGNHIHLLIKEGDETLGTAFRRLGASYVYWYNQKYNRTGHLFQDRFKSEAVESDDYFLTVMRYIHQNPVKAGIVKDISDYRWSSYREYVQKPVICNTEFALNIFSKNPKEALEQWIKFNHNSNSDQCLEFDDGERINDIKAAELIKEITGVKNPEDIKSVDKQKKKVYIKMMKDKGLSIRQIARLTGISFAVVRGV